MKKYQLVINEKGKQFVREYGIWTGLAIIFLVTCIGITFSSELASTRLAYCLLLLFLGIPIMKYQYRGYQYYFYPQTLIIDGNSISLSTLLYLEPFAFVSFILSDGQGMVKLTLSNPRVEGRIIENAVLILRESLNMTFSAITADGRTEIWSKFEMRNLHYRDKEGKNALLSKILVGSGFVEKIEPYKRKTLKIDLVRARKAVKNNLKNVMWMMRHKNEIRELNIEPMSDPGIPEKSLDESVTKIKKELNKRRNT